MKKIVSILMMVMMLIVSSCANNQTTIRNGKVDPVEAATIQIAVGVAFAANPKTIVPAYAVTTALLKIMSNNNEEVVPSMVKDMIFKEIDKLKLDKLTLLSMHDLISLVEAEIKMKVDAQYGDANKLVVIKQVVKIIHDTAEARIGITMTN
jgi:hypothetical protein